MPLFAALVAIAFALSAGCGSTEQVRPLSDTDHNQADVSFSKDMLQHHAQALAMVNLTVERPMDPELEALATRIRDAQAQEIEVMADWLLLWGESIPETSNDHQHADMGTMPEGTEDMPGMMTADEMRELESASDTDFGATWLTMLIRHHRGAIEMAETEKVDGQFRPAVDLARSIISSQGGEIAEMEDLLAKL